jgi:hypothetical protein
MKHVVLFHDFVPARASVAGLPAVNPGRSGSSCRTR